MSEPKLISPLLDGFMMGEPMSDHHGVRCCPAIRENADEKYIVKIISIPASQMQLDALLLTGAYTDPAQALAYFKELSEDVTGEADILNNLSKLEGFVPYLDYQVVQMDEGVGYDVYLVSPYKRTLEKQMRVDPLTHLGAVNLGLDMCAALAVSRRAGYLYADLKPGNIFLTENQGYRIGDLGFISLSSLKYASLPEKYRSSYTAPEISDAMAALNDTIDIYALGLVLYQVYNNGQLPFDGAAPSEKLAPPLYADYEMAEIILKACAPDPKDRWQDPAQMGQALVNYMQRNSVNDTPIVPPPVELPEEPEEDEEEFLSEDENDAELAELLAMIPDEEPPSEEPQEETPAGESAEEESVQEDGPEAENEDDSQETATETDETAEEVPEETETDLAFIDEAPVDETVPTEESTADLDDAEVTEEVAEMLAQADELISHELPEPVVAPDPIDVPIPPPIVLEPEAAEEPESVEESEEESDKLVIVLPHSDDETAAEEEPSQEESAEESPAEEAEEISGESEDEVDDSEYVLEYPEEGAKKPFIASRWNKLALVIVLLAVLAFGAYYFYHEFYLQTIDAFNIVGTEKNIAVMITSDVDEDLLTVVCTDTYGNTRRSPVSGGMAVFNSLSPNTQYKIEVEISGYHKLLGTTTGSYTTSTQTEIRNFTAIAGPEDGSVILSFSVNGPEGEAWIVEYSAAGIASQTLEFTGHTVTVTGLTVGADYTFRLTPKTELYLTGTCELNYTAQNVIFAQNLGIESCGGGSLNAVWTAPEGVEAQTWSVRCYNDAGYDQTITTPETSYEFTGLDHSTGYTVKVTAVGMTQSVSTTVTANPVNVTGFSTERTDSWAMTLSWDFTGEAPQSGWELTYRIDEGNPIMVTCSSNSTQIALAPGCSYTFEVRPADDITYYTVPFSYDEVTVDSFEGYTVSTANMTFKLVPQQEIADPSAIAGVTEYAPDAAVMLLGQVDKVYDETKDPFVVTFVIKDADNNLISTDKLNTTWEKLWKARVCQLDIPQMPDTAGAYTIDVYFNDLYVTTQQFTII